MDKEIGQNIILETNTKTVSKQLPFAYNVLQLTEGGFLAKIVDAAFCQVMLAVGGTECCYETKKWKFENL